jgi:hypothetical protein
MSKFVGFLTLLLIGALVLPGASSGVKASGGPAITQSFATQEIRPGDTWKVYFNALDPSGKMKYIYAVVEQPGGKGYPLSMIRIKPENRSELSGYIILNTNYATRPMDYITLKLVVNVGDGRGNFSESAVFPLTFQPRANAQTPPPSGVFKENNLGPINIHLDPGADGGGSSGFGN